MTKQELIKKVNASLSCFLWGGHVIDVHKNQWGEWIADCIVYNPDYFENRAISLPKPRNWQYMIEVYKAFSVEGVILHPAHDDKREMTFVESLGFYDENAPRSPYIDELVRKYEYEDGVF